MIIFLILVFLNVSIQSQVEAKINFFSIDLIHCASPLSPFYNHSITQSELLKRSVMHSLSRVGLFNSSIHVNRKTIVSELIPHAGCYIMEIYIGSPKVKVFAIADTGSDLIWIQCKPCETGDTLDAPLYDPEKSSTYKMEPFGSKFCKALRYRYLGIKPNSCGYSYHYGLYSSVRGTLSSETLNTDSSNGEVIRLPDLVFGCSHEVKGTFKRPVQGMVGLGRGLLSLVSQLGNQIENKFSYCLLPRLTKASSKLSFGRQAKIFGDGLVSTPLIFRDDSNFYIVGLEGVSVGDMEKKTLQSPIDIVIDSGSALPLLHSSIYNDLEATIKDLIGINLVTDLTGMFNLCYEVQQSKNINFPDVVFHFIGADLRLKPSNIFQEYNNMYCMLIDRDDGRSIFGNVAQVNFQVQFDLQERRVSFAPADCTEV